MFNYNTSNDIEKGYADLFSAIWKQAVYDDSNTYKDTSIDKIRENVYKEALKWTI